MTFWIALLAGIGLAVFGIRKGFLTMWVMLFNLLVSIFLAVMLTPTIVGLIPDLQTSYYNHAVLLLIISVILFAVIHYMATILLLEKKRLITLPPYMDTVASGVMGFFTGFVAAAFVLFIFYVCPVAKHDSLDVVFGSNGHDSQPFVVGSVSRTCSFVNRIQFHYNEAPVVVEWLADYKDKLEEEVEKN